MEEDFEAIASSPSSSSTTTTSSTSDPNAAKPAKEGRESNRKRQQDTKHNTYHGVRMRNWGRWVSEIREPRKKSRIWLGTYPTAEMAARAHDVAELTIKGPAAAHLNFPELAHLLPRPATAAPKDIQVAAAKATAVEYGHLTVPGSPAPVNSSSNDDDEKLFDLPDLFSGLEDGLCHYSSLWVSMSECDSHDIGFRLDDHDPFLWELS